MRLYFLLVTVACLSPLPVAAQIYSPPGYGFPGMFPGGNQSPFLTMPPPQFYNMAPQSQTSPFAQPGPFWILSPPSARTPSRYIEHAPSSTPRQNSASSPPTYAPRNAPFQSSAQSGPPRWAPLPGEAPVVIVNPRAGSLWATPPAENGAERYAPATESAFPKWPTP